MPSNLIEKFSYDAETSILSVWLRSNRRRYDYEDVPPEIYPAFCADFSKAPFLTAISVRTFLCDATPKPHEAGHCFCWSYHAVTDGTDCLFHRSGNAQVRLCQLPSMLIDRGRSLLLRAI